tara:strand:+ start:345 stop:824 length:480 start_codon:yes stop_codon:yes gene_type:complete
MKYQYEHSKKSPIEEIILEMLNSFLSVANKDKTAKSWSDKICYLNFTESQVRAVCERLAYDMDRCPSLKHIIDRLKNERGFNSDEREVTCKKCPYGNGDLSIIEETGNFLYVENVCSCKRGIDGFIDIMRKNKWKIHPNEPYQHANVPEFEEFIKNMEV